MKPKRIQLSHTKGWRKPAGAVVVTRRTKYGNPYLIVDLSRPGQPVFAVKKDGEEYGQFGEKRAAAEMAVNQFEIDLFIELKHNPSYLNPLRGKDLCCYCRLDWPCHGDVLLRYANQ